MFRLLRVRLSTKTAAASNKRKLDAVKQELEEKYLLESEVKSRCAQYPNRILTRPCLKLDVKDIRRPLFSNQLMSLNKMAHDTNVLSFCGPKGHWDASVVLLRGNPLATEFEVWVNPDVPGYDEKHSVAPMYGMWENCASCGPAYAWVLRPQSVVVSGYDEFGNEKKEVLEGMRARLLMHELDHLNGKTILQQALGPDFIVSQQALQQKQLWPAGFPSMEAQMTDACQFFDYVTNQPIIPPGMEMFYMHYAQQQFGDQKLT